MTGDMAFLPGCQVVQLCTTTEPLVVVVGVVMVLLGRVGGDNGVDSGGDCGGGNGVVGWRSGGDVGGDGGGGVWNCGVVVGGVGGCCCGF